MVRLAIEGNPRLRSVTRKVEHARKHVDSLDEALQRFYKAATESGRRRFDDQAGEWVFEYTEVPEPSDELSLIFGDFVHNLRSALDHLAFQLVKYPRIEPLGDKAPDDKIQLPIYCKESWYDDARIKGADAGARARVKSFQPFRDKSDPLWLIHSLDIWDKHRLFPVLIHSITAIDFMCDTTGFKIEKRGLGRPLVGGAEIVRWKLPPGSDPDMDVGLFFGFSMKIIKPPTGDRDLRVLTEDMLTTAWGVVAALADFVAPPG